MARRAVAHLALERVLFIPTGPTHYRAPAIAAAEDRLAMLRLALQGEPRFAIDARELAPGATGYTVDTLAALHREHPGQTLYLLMGADQYAKLERWSRPDEVRRLARIAVFARPGWKLEGGEATVVPFEPLEVSATAIRARAARGEVLAGLVPEAVANYILTHRLYA